jgi:glycosyltransferase involved in cell wall biosynthesis
MRVGQNPARFVEKVAQPAEITVAVVNCIPFLSGYYAQGLEVLKAVVESLNASREPAHPYDVMVFDNHSCAEVRDYLKEACEQGRIQYLTLSNGNIGKLGAWNAMFGAAQGKYVVFADGDILFSPGWLSASLELFETFPNVGMVTARPLRTPMEYSSATIEWANKQADGVYERGQFLDFETYWEHARSTGYTQDRAREEFSQGRDHRLVYHGKTAFVGATHFQFMAPAELLKRIIPLPSEQPMRGERTLDIRINELGYLRLLTSTPLVAHMGNTLLPASSSSAAGGRSRSLFRRLLWSPLVRRPLLWLNNRIFRLYFFNVE